MLNWYGHVKRMNEDKPPRKFFEWCPPGRRRKGRWMQKVTIRMREMEINNME